MLCRSRTFRLVPRFITSSFVLEKAARWFAQRAALLRSSQKTATMHSLECLRVKLGACRLFVWQRSDRSETPNTKMFRLVKQAEAAGRADVRKFAVSR